MKKVAAALAFLALACVVSWCVGRRSGRDAGHADGVADGRRLAEAGFREAEVKTPERPADVPRGARPLARVRGQVDYGPRAGGPADSSEPTTRGTTLRQSAPPARDCWRPVEADLAGSCDAVLVEVAGRPWYRITWEGKVRTPEGEVVRRAVLEDVEAEVARAVVATAPRWRAEGRIGLRSDGSYEVGASAYPWASRRFWGRLGVFGEASWGSRDDPEAAAGVAFRLR